MLWWLVPMIVLTVMLSWGEIFNGSRIYSSVFSALQQVPRGIHDWWQPAGINNCHVGIERFFNPQIDKKSLTKPLLIGTAITGGISLIFAIIPSLAEVSALNQMPISYSNFPMPQTDFSFLADTLAADRKAMLQTDAFDRSFYNSHCSVIWLYINNKLKQNLVIASMGVLLLLVWYLWQNVI